MSPVYENTGTYTNPMMDYYGFFSVLGFLVPLAGLAGIIGIIYIIIKSIISGGGSSSKMEAAKKGYYYLISLITLGILYVAVSDVIRLVLEYVSPGSQMSIGSGFPGTYGYENFVRGIVFRSSVIIFVLPLFLFHWASANKKPKEVDEETALYIKKERKSYLHIVLTVASLILMITGPYLLYNILLLVLGVGKLSLRDFSFPLSYFVGIVGVWIYHYAQLKSAEE